MRSRTFLRDTVVFLSIVKINEKNIFSHPRKIFLSLSLLHRLDKKVMASKIVKKEVMSDEIKVIEKNEKRRKKVAFLRCV